MTVLLYNRVWERLMAVYPALLLRTRIEIVSMAMCSYEVSCEPYIIDVACAICPYEWRSKHWTLSTLEENSLVLCSPISHWNERSGRKSDCGSLYPTRPFDVRHLVGELLKRWWKDDGCNTTTVGWSTKEQLEKKDGLMRGVEGPMRGLEDFSRRLVKPTTEFGGPERKLGGSASELKEPAWELAGREPARVLE